MKPTLVCAAALLSVGCSQAPAPASASFPAVGSIVRVDSGFDPLVPKGSHIEKVASGFTFIEGPLWRPNGVLWFSDVTGNVVRQWAPDGTVTEILKAGGIGATGLPPSELAGPNGTTAGKDGAVLLCQQGNRRIVRITKDGHLATAADRFDGKKLNSPNDLVYRSDGTLYFTDPPYGLRDDDRDRAKELRFNGVFRLTPEGDLQVAVRDLSRPNGIALSPDEKTLYVANSDEKRKVWMRYDVAADGAISNGKVFADVTEEKGGGLPDGMKVDSLGNVYATGPGGVWIFSAEGKHLGTFKPPETPANCAWGDDGKTLYMTARTSLYRVKLAVSGQRLVY